MQRERRRCEEREKLKRMQEEARLSEQVRRNAARAKQELAEVTAYERHYGEVSHTVVHRHDVVCLCYIYKRMKLRPHDCPFFFVSRYL